MISIDNAVIEVTRWCNMHCGHCMRGDKQKKKIKNEYINSFFSKINYINSLFITGGEPFLAMDRIEYIIHSILYNKVDVGNFYIVTNGKYIPKDFIDIITCFYNICSDNEISGVVISQDCFHDWIDKDRIYRIIDELIYGRGLPKNILGFKNDPEKLGHYDWIINQGHAEGMGRDKKVYKYIIDGNSIRENEVYLNCKGNIINCCDLSYKNQDNPEHIVCHVDDMSLNKFKPFSNKGE